MLPTLATRKPPAHRGAAALIALLAGLSCAAQPAPPKPAEARAVPPGVEEPPPSAGYSKLRLDLQLSVDGRPLAPVLLLETFNATAGHVFALPDGRRLRVLVEGRPHRDERFPDQGDLLLLEFSILDQTANKLLAQPRLISKDQTAARIEIGKPGDGQIRLDVLPRIVLTRLHDASGALAELRREIEAGQAPALFAPR